MGAVLSLSCLVYFTTTLISTFTFYIIRYRPHYTVKKLGGVDEDEQGIRFSTTMSTRWRSEGKKRILDWISVGIMMGGIVDHYGLKRIIQLQ